MSGVRRSRLAPLDMKLLKERSKQSALALREVPSDDLLPHFFHVFAHHLDARKVPLRSGADTSDALQCFTDLIRGTKTPDDKNCILPLWPRIFVWSIYLLNQKSDTHLTHAVRLLDFLYFGLESGFRRLITDSRDLGPLILQSWVSRHPSAVEETRLLYLFLPQGDKITLKSQRRRDPLLTDIEKDPSLFAQLCMSSFVSEVHQTSMTNFDPQTFSDSMSLIESSCFWSTAVLQAFVANDIMHWLFYAIRRFTALAAREPIFRWVLDIAKAPGLCLWALFNFLKDRLLRDVTIPMAAKLLDHHILDYIVKLGRLLQLERSNNMLVMKMWTLLSSLIDQYTQFACYRSLLWRINRSIKAVERTRDNVPAVPARMKDSWNQLKATADFYTAMRAKHDEKHGKSTCSFTECVNASGTMYRPFSTCSGCEQVVYCSAECQRKHWIDHKKACIEMRGDLEVMRPCSREHDLLRFIAFQVVMANDISAPAGIRGSTGRDIWRLPVSAVSYSALPLKTTLMRMSDFRGLLHKKKETYRTAITDLKALIQDHGAGNIRIVCVFMPPFAESHWPNECNWQLTFLVL